MDYSKESSELTREVKEKALSSGAELAGVISTASIDAVPKHWVGWEILSYTQKTTDYMDEPRSVIVLGYQAWDDIHELMIPKGDWYEYPVYQRMRLFARRLLRFLEGKGYRAVIYPNLLSQKRVAQLAGLGCFGKNSLIINPKYGPWFRLQSILTDAELVPDAPFEEDLCGDCEECIKACPVGALTPYKIDPEKCLLGTYLNIKDDPEYRSLLDEHMPNLTKNGVIMCMTCQKTCIYGREERGLEPLE